MKRITVLLLAIILILSLSSCKVNYVQSDKTYAENSASYIIQMRHVPRDMAIQAYFDYYEGGSYAGERYSGEDTVIYIPISGEYETEDGEKFTAVVGDYAEVFILKDTYHSRIGFDVTILDEDGNVIIKKENFNSYVEVGDQELDLTYVDGKFARYWSVIAVRSDKLLNNN